MALIHQQMFLIWGIKGKIICFIETVEVLRVHLEVQEPFDLACNPADEGVKCYGIIAGLPATKHTTSVNMQLTINAYSLFDLPGQVHEHEAISLCYIRFVEDGVMEVLSIKR